MKQYRLRYGVPVAVPSGYYEPDDLAYVDWDPHEETIYAESDEDARKQSKTILAKKSIKHAGFEYYAHVLSLIEEVSPPVRRSLL